MKKPHIRLRCMYLRAIGGQILVWRADPADGPYCGAWFQDSAKAIGAFTHKVNAFASVPNLEGLIASRRF